jgi:drug/metabolite transporter (DMT)-like permease
MIWYARLGTTTQGIVVMICALFILAAMDTLAKYLMQWHDPLQVVWARYSLHTLVVFIYFAPRLRTLLVTRHFRLQLVRSAFLFGATFMYFQSLSRMGLADTAAIFNVNPLIITIFAYFVLREPIGQRRIFGVVVGLIGALIIIRPGSSVVSPFAWLPLLAALSFAGYVISTRFLGRDENILTSLIYSTLIGTIVASAIVAPVWQTPTWPVAIAMLVMGAMGGLGQFLLIRAFTIAPASAIAPFSYVALILAVVYGYLVFGDLPDLITIFGAVVIVGSGLYVWHRERQSETAQTALASPLATATAPTN